MKERLAELIANHGLKHWSFAARKDQEFMDWVNQQTASLPEDVGFADRVYAATSGTSPICERGGRKSLDSIERGWRFCGRAAKCVCAAESVSKNAKATFEKMGEDARKARHKKSVETLIVTKGVNNAGQTDNAKARHSEFYADKSRVRESTEKNRKTMLEKYGVDNALKLPIVQESRKFLPSTRTSEQKAIAAEKRRKSTENGELLAFGYRRVVERVSQNGIQMVTPVEQYLGTAELHYYSFVCDACETAFQDYIKDGHEPKCIKCNPPDISYSSQAEIEIREFIASYYPIVHSNRKTIAPFEIDIFIPELMLAIEYCGLYWHSEIGGNKNQNYHLNKLELCEQKGIRLITIFEDEWLTKPEIVKSRLLNAIGVSKKLYARKLQICYPTAEETSSFLEKTHIQGRGTSASVRIGLKNGADLVAVMTFGSLRVSNNSQPIEGSYELYRYASIGTIVGGASKMFKEFIRKYNPTSILSYCDRRWGQGGVYKQLGFELDGETEPGYWWLTDRYTRRQHRYNFAKHKLVSEGHDSNKTEIQIMRDLGHDRIWDCGNYRFIWRK